MPTRRTWIATTALVLTLQASAVLAQQGPKDAARAASVGVDTVISEQASQTVPVIGRLVAQNAGDVSAQIKGVVTEMRVHVGDRVAQGDVLAVLSPDSLKWARELRAAEIASAEADLANARAQARLRAQELKRLDDLRQSSAFSPARREDAVQELAKAESGAARAASDLQRARSNLRLADIDLDNAQVKAPYAGVVSAVHTAVGVFLDAGKPVVSMIDDMSMEVEAEVPANRVAGLTPGTVVSFTLGETEKFAAVRAQVPEENPLTRTRKVRFTPSDDMLDEGAAANQNVTLHIPAGPARSAVTVHKDAVVNKGGQRVVFVVEDGKAALRPVELGEAVGGRFVVLSGLKPGDVVVVRGNERLAPGQAVQPIGKNGGQGNPPAKN